MTKTVKAYDANDNVVFSAIAINDDEVDMLVEYAFRIDQARRIEVR